MGIFGKIFEKKYCSVCGEEIKLLGNRKLEDGNLCKNCAKKLSPWFDDRRHSTVEEIKAQLAYREANRAQVERFRVTRTLGKGMKLLLDEDAGKFMVTNAERNALPEENPDVLSFGQITGCDVDVEQREHEETRTVKDKEGHSKSVSYVPPHIEYSYDFYVKIHVDAPYFNELRFRVNPSTVKLRPWEQTRPIPRTLTPEYREYNALSEEIRRAVEKAREQGRTQAKPKAPVVCPCCGASTLPDERGCCEYCGSPLPN